MDLFLNLSRFVSRPATLLDVGGTVSFWRRRIPDGFAITLLNLFDQEPIEGVDVVIGDATSLAGFETNSFDIVFSNSVLGHVGGWARQQQMAGEIRRVARRYFVQTPNHGFPLDWRTMVPFFHWLPPSMQAWLFQRIPVGRYPRVYDRATADRLATRVRNITHFELKTLFPEGTIVPERVCGLTKSFIVHTVWTVPGANSKCM